MRKAKNSLYIMFTSRKSVKDHNEKTSVIKTWKSMLIFPQLASLILLGLVASVLHLKYNNGKLVRVENVLVLKQEKSASDDQECNLYSGEWIYDDASYPHYKEKECSFLVNDFTCEAHGRKKLRFQNWRWQPHNCDLPRFNGAAFLEKMRGKRLLFVGDSLNRNQWKSMLCLIQSALPPSDKKEMHLDGNLYYFYSKGYDCTIGLYWAPFLVESNADQILIHGGEKSQIMGIKSIHKHGIHWIDADVLVFDSFAWWMNPNKVAMWGSFGSSDAVFKEVDSSFLLYEIALNTWSEWMEMQINRTKTQVFFMSASPFTRGNTHWGTTARCYNISEPILEEREWSSSINRSMMEIVESTVERLKQRAPDLRVEYVNITQLSSYREDAHPSIYKTFWNKVDKLPFKDPNVYSDCIHWCLPGVPDIWNQFLYAYIMKKLV